ncbi:MAG: hypothetical protein JSW47_20575 [Phycisphaerales bacterium]|nr:MAG: hypothetical protein JSW47_20575 [Phycisphaerales bacterium]UCF16806.1 MAG: hypothetical protein JSW59_04965 [Phycisphaerales bacterium]
MRVEEVCTKAFRILTFVLGIAVVLCGSTVKADLANDGFETCDLAGWSATGMVQVVDREFSRDFLGLAQAPAGRFWDPTAVLSFHRHAT